MKIISKFAQGRAPAMLLRALLSLTKEKKNIARCSILHFEALYSGPWQLN